MGAAAARVNAGSIQGNARYAKSSRNRRRSLARSFHSRANIADMSDSLLDRAIDSCHDVLSRMSDEAKKRELLARLGVLEQASANLTLGRAASFEVVRLASQILDLR
jgi:hypothetical protein